MLKRSSVMAALVIAFVVVLAACGGNGDDSSTASAATLSTPSAVVESTTVPLQPGPTSSQEGGAAPQATQVPVSSTSMTSSEASPAGQTSQTPAPVVVSASNPSAQASQDTPGRAISTVEVVKILKPSVVQILTELSAMGSVNQAVPSTGVGTGVILDKQGHILTNNHVIRGAQSITVTLDNGKSFPAVLIGGDATTDTAVIKIEAEDLQPAKLGSSADLQVGEDVIAIGHALGLPGGPTVSKGVVSALGRSIDVDPRTTMVDLIQTDASINPGNSGGPLANDRAEVIGINTAVIRGSQGIGFAINIDDAQFVVAQLLDRGYVDRGFLGISPVTLTAALARRVGTPVEEGILIVRIVPGSAADLAGLESEDVIVQLGGDSVLNTGELSKFLVLHAPGEIIEVVFYRGDDEMVVQLMLGECPMR